MSRRPTILEHLSILDTVDFQNIVKTGPLALQLKGNFLVNINT